MQATFKAVFGDIKIGKKTTIAVEIKGDLSDSQKLALLEFANSDGFVQLASAQRDIEDYEPKHVGLAYTLKGAEVQVNSEQLDMEDVIVDAVDFDKEGQEPAEGHERQLNWLEQEELIAEQEAQEEDELSDELD